MLSNKNALILFWTGNNIPDSVVEEIASILVVHGVTIPELLKVIYKDQDAIANALTVEANGEKAIRIDVVDNNEALKNSIVYIGRKYKDQLKSWGLIQFAILLQRDLTYAKTDDSADCVALRKAVEIIATTAPEKIPADFAKKHNVTKIVCRAIRQVYNQHT